MRSILPEALEVCRVNTHFGAPNEGRNGRFVMQGPCGAKLHINSWDHKKYGWEQVAVSTDRKRCPNWLEMCHVKNLFWDEQEMVIQIHPPLSEYVKNSRHCLHLWRPTREAIPAPPSHLAGIVGFGPDESAQWMNKLFRSKSDEELAAVLAEPMGVALSTIAQMRKDDDADPISI
jgi:hypothetical protein